MGFMCGIEVTLYSTTLLKTVMFSVPPAACSNCGHGKQASKCRTLQILVSTLQSCGLQLYIYLTHSIVENMMLHNARAIYISSSSFFPLRMNESFILHYIFSITHPCATFQCLVSRS